MGLLKSFIAQHLGARSLAEEGSAAPLRKLCGFA